MIIDAHSHLGASCLAFWKNEVDEEGFIANMNKWGIDKSIVNYWGIFYDPVEGNDEIANFAKKYPDRIIGFGVIVPRFYKIAVDEVVRVKNELGMKGLKLHPTFSQYYADSPLVYPVVEKAIELNMPMLFHCGSDEYSHPRLLGNLAKRYPEGTFIMAHMGEDAICEGVQVAGQNKNIMVDTAGLYNLYDILNYAIHFIGEDRILFGSDFPAYNSGPEISKVKDANITDTQKEKILGLNAKRIFGL